jgi:hypothetical protein
MVEGGSRRIDTDRSGVDASALDEDPIMAANANERQRT